MTRHLKFSVLAAAKVFEEAEWKYSYRSGEHVPDAEEIASTIRRLVDGFNDDENDILMISSGRFMVQRDTFGDVTVYLELGQP